MMLTIRCTSTRAVPYLTARFTVFSCKNERFGGIQFNLCSSNQVGTSSIMPLCAGKESFWHVIAARGSSKLVRDWLPTRRQNLTSFSSCLLWPNSYAINSSHELG